MDARDICKSKVWTDDHSFKDMGGLRGMFQACVNIPL